MNKNLVPRAALGAICVAVVSLTACGGGGGDGDSGTPTNTTPTITAVNVAAFEHNLLRSNRQWAMNGTATSGGQSAPFTVAFANAATSSAVFPLTSVSGNTSQQTSTTSMGGVSQTTLLTSYYDDADLVFGFVAAINGATSCATVASSAQLPVAANLGASGPLRTATNYSSCQTSAYVVGSNARTWSVETESGIVFVCDNATTPYPGSLCIESDSNGVVGTRARYSATAAGITMTARNY